MSRWETTSTLEADVFAGRRMGEGLCERRGVAEVER